MAVTTQPRGRKQEIEAFVRDLDPLTVQGRPTSDASLISRMHLC